MRPADWYMMIMNELDEELTRRNLDTRIVFLSYLDTMFAPEQIKIKNIRRFSLLHAPITRTYTESVAQRPVSTASLPKYVRNKVDLPTASDTGIAFAKSWQETCNVDILVYEYHFWYNMAYEFSTTKFAKIINEDIKGYKYHKFGGTIEDGSQRGFFPNGFPFYTYGQTLFDTSLDFDQL